MSTLMDKLFAAVCLIALIGGLLIIILMVILRFISDQHAIETGLVQKVVMVPETLGMHAHSETIWTKPDQPTTVEVIK